MSRTILLNAISMATGMLLISGVGTATAEAPEALMTRPAAPLTPSVAQSNQASGCSSAQAGDEFTERVREIFEHGTLLDIPFFEKTLNVKFDKQEGRELLDQRTYRANATLCGVTISINLFLNANHYQQMEMHFIGMVRFGLDKSLRITADQLSQRFKKEKIYTRPIPDGADLSSVLQASGENGTLMQLGYSYTPDDTILGVAIQQFPSAEDGLRIVQP
jgi:hypothetical protein